MIIDFFQNKVKNPFQMQFLKW